jgi:hypothetical protein
MALQHRGPVKLMPDEEDELAALRLTHWLRSGGALPDVHPTFPGGGWMSLGPGESCRHQGTCTMSAYTSAEAAHNQGWFVAGGSTKMVAGSLAASALYNRSQRRRAEAYAAEQWRPVANGPMIVTTHRLIIATNQWVSLSYANFEYAYLQEPHPSSWGFGTGIRFGVSGSDALFLQVPGQSRWLFVLLTYLGRGLIVDVAPSPSLVRKLDVARASERQVVSRSGALVPIQEL